jgi:hypothetical protein
MNQMGRVVLAMGLVIVMTGCFEHTYTVGQGAPAGPVVYEEWSNSWLGGLIGEKNLDVSQLCPSGNATIHDEQSLLNGLVSFLTGGIYTPTTVEVRCDSGRSAEIGFSRSEVIAIVTSQAFMDRVERVMPGRLAEAQLGVQALEQDMQDD